MVCPRNTEWGALGLGGYWYSPAGIGSERDVKVDGDVCAAGMEKGRRDSRSQGV